MGRFWRGFATAAVVTSLSVGVVVAGGNVSGADPGSGGPGPSVTSPFRSAAGAYVQRISILGGPSIAVLLVLAPDHTFFIGNQDSGLTGTWSQPDLAGTIVLFGTSCGTTFLFSALKTVHGLGLPRDQGAFSVNGRLVGTWWASVLDAGAPPSNTAPALSPACG